MNGFPIGTKFSGQFNGVHIGVIYLFFLLRKAEGRGVENLLPFFMVAKWSPYRGH